eukprot:m.240622 g.240622  ORF g.240622 m.240622 type:complete len:282 (-) comp13699_c0_seq1:82-927(-)
MADSNKIRIVTDIIRRAPAGEFNAVFTDLKAILPPRDEAILSENALSACIAYDEDIMHVVTLPNDRKSLVTKHGRIGLSTYLDPSTNTLFKFDHLKKEVSDVKPHERTALWELTDPARKVYEARVQQYIQEYYPAGVAVVYAKNVQSEDEIIVCIEDHAYQAANFYNGLWRSEWRLNVKTGKLIGHLRIALHCLEDGNMHVTARKDAELQIPVGAPDVMSAAFAKAIRKEESAFQARQIEACTTDAEAAVKTLRRALPVTRFKMDWNQLVLYEVGKKLAAR